MRYRVDHDLHIHSYISPCARHDTRQTKEAILAYGLTNEFQLLCVTDHFWDRKAPQSFDLWLRNGLDVESARDILPLPQSPRCKFLFGMEVDMDPMGNIGITKGEYDTFDFLILAPSHIHVVEKYLSMEEDEDIAKAHKRWYQERIFRFLNADLPFEKCGLAHFTTGLVCKAEPVKVFELFTDREYREIFKQVAERGIGVEINFEKELHKYASAPDTLEEILRPYRIAKEMGCTFYLGGDAHVPEAFAGQKEFFEHAIELLGLKEKDKFPLVKQHLAMMKCI